MLRTAQRGMAEPRDFLPDLYNARMPSHGSTRGRTERRRTEQRNPASKNLDRMTAREIVRLMNWEDSKVARAVGRESAAIAQAVDTIVGGIRKGGRLIYVGAGSSGRMGVLDAAECPPTFGTSAKLVVALIAGGRRAITQAGGGGEGWGREGAGGLGAIRVTREGGGVGNGGSRGATFLVGGVRYEE